MGGSDDTSFNLHGIPSLFFFTGVHPDYHKPSDTWAKINGEGTAKLLRLVAETVSRTSWLKERPKFVKGEAVRPAPGGGFRVSLGTIPDYASEVEGVALQGVRPGSPADKAGIKAGDVLVEFDGKKIRNVQEYTAVLSGARPNVPIQLVVLRKGQRVALTATPEARGN
jgi:S1-C subfamily serine protease